MNRGRVRREDPLPTCSAAAPRGPSVSLPHLTGLIYGGPADHRVDREVGTWVTRPQTVRP